MVGSAHVVLYALIGAYAGAAMANAALHHGIASIFSVVIPQGWYKTLIFIVVAPVIGLVLGFIFMLSVYWIFRRWRRSPSTDCSAGCSYSPLPPIVWVMAPTTPRRPWGSSPVRLPHRRIYEQVRYAGKLGSFALAHHLRPMPPSPPEPTGAVGASNHGQRITKLKPVGGFCAELRVPSLASATALAGIPVSTTHTITGAIVGVGAVHRLSAVRWGVAGRIVWA